MFRVVKTFASARDVVGYIHADQKQSPVSDAIDPQVMMSFVPSEAIALTPPFEVSATQFEVLPVNAKFVSVPSIVPMKSFSVVVPFPASSSDGHHQAISPPIPVAIMDSHRSKQAKNHSTPALPPVFSW